MNVSGKAPRPLFPGANESCRWPSKDQVDRAVKQAETGVRNAIKSVPGTELDVTHQADIVSLRVVGTFRSLQSVKDALGACKDFEFAKLSDPMNSSLSLGYWNSGGDQVEVRFLPLRETDARDLGTN